MQDRGYGLCICDECHHGISDSYTEVFEGLGFLDDDPNKLLVGFTATAFRGDGGALGDVFQESSILAMIKGGYLCDIRGIKIQTGTHLEGVSTRLGDFVTSDLSEAIDTPGRNQLIAEAYLEHAGDRKAIVFCVDVQHAQHVADVMANNDIPCRAVYGDMDADDRREVLNAFAAGDVRVLTNCNLLTEGWDSPDLGAVLMARPTKSRVLYIQCVGRGLRTSPGKEDCLLLDFVDIAGRHDICAFGTLDGDAKLKPRQGQSLLEAAEEEAKALEAFSVGVPRAPAHTTEAFSLFDRSRFAWLASGRNFRLSIGNDQSVVCSPMSTGGYGVYLVEANGAATQLCRMPLPLEYAQGTAEDYARKNAQGALIDKHAAWRGDAATERQLDLLVKMGIPHAPNITKGEAQTLISAAFNEPPTERQLYCIRVNGLHPNPAILTKREARVLIGQYHDRRSA